MIEEYNFGSIIIKGKEYTEDVEIRWTGEVLNWWRKESHLVEICDIKRAIEHNPSTIVIGTGNPGLMKVSDSAKKFILNKGIKLIIDVTEQAVKTFNIICQDSKEEEGEQDKVIGLFHLTC